jgi:hypothetical protein
VQWHHARSFEARDKFGVQRGHGHQRTRLERSPESKSDSLERFGWSGVLGLDNDKIDSTGRKTALASMRLKVQRFLRGARGRRGCRHAAFSRHSQTSPAISEGGGVLDFCEGRVKFAELLADALDR